MPGKEGCACLECRDMAEIIVDEELVYVPDGVACPTCGFSFVSKQWKLGALCPFDQAPYERATWKQYAAYLGKRNDEAVKVNRTLHQASIEMARQLGQV